MLQKRSRDSGDQSNQIATTGNKRRRNTERLCRKLEGRGDLLEEVILTDEQLQDKLKYWQEKLRLQDWIVTVELCRARDIEPNRSAEIEWAYGKRMASIRILDPIDYPPGLMAPQDMEDDIVHELLHLHLLPLRPENEEFNHVGEEQAIETIASGLLATHREVRRNDSH